MSGTPELRALTSVRGIAAWMVVLFHIRFSLGLPTEWLRFFSRGYLAVDFFFLLSGFVIWMTWHLRIREHGWPIVPHFLRKRIARIWPLHLVMLGFAVVLALVLKLIGRPDDVAFPFADLPYHVFLVQNWRGYGTLVWNDPAWSISAELFAYLLFPILAMRIDWRRWPSVAILAAIGAMIAVLAAVMTARGMEALGDGIAQFGLIRCVCEFSCGTAVAALWLRWRDHAGRATLAAAGVAVVAFGAYLSGALVEMAAVPIAFAALLLGLALTSDKPGNPLSHRYIHYLGEISYATYLCHMLLWKAFKLIFVEDAHAVPLALIALYLAIVLGCSIALYHLVERPAQRWINDLQPPRRRARNLGLG